MTELEWMDIFADNLREIMQEKGYTQEELADDAGLTQATISRYVNKIQMPGVRAIVNMVYALDCGFDELLDFGDRIEG